MLQLLDLNKNKIAGLTEYKDLCIESVLKTGDKTLSFLYSNKSKHYFKIVEEAYIRTKQDEFVIKEINVESEFTTFICKLNVEELEGKTFDRFESKEQTITAALNLAIVGTGWTVQDNTINKKRTIRKTNCSSWEIIQDIKNTYRVDIEFDSLNKKIKVYESLGSDKGAYFIDSLNLKSINIQSNSYDFYTRMIPVGKDRITIESVNNGKNYVENYQYSNKVKTIYWKDERYTIKENLKDDAIAKLKEISKPYKAYSVEILNLASLNDKYKDVLDYHLGDTITLISKDNNIKEKQRIVKTKIYPEDHFKDSCELYNTILSFEDIQTQFEEAAETIDNVTTDNGTIDGSTVDSIEVKQIEDFEANVIKVSKLKAILAEIESLHTNKADIQNLNAIVAKIGTLEATKASIIELNAIDAVIQNLKTGKADISELNAAVSKIGILESKTSSIDNLLAQKADIKDLNALNANISDALIKKANVAELEAMEAKTNKLIANKADISDLNSTNANINSLKADTADIKTLINGNLSSENIQTGGITSDKLTISDGFIKDAMIANVSASKLAAGTIDASKINVVNLNADNLTVGKINGHLLKDGSISGLAIGNGVIDNSKVAPGANIEASKININSVVTAINAGSTLLTANKIAIDSDKGTLDLAFKNLNTSLDANKKATESNSTAINVVQGKINASIENSKVLEGKQKTLEDNYNRTVITVDSLKNTIGSHKTLIDSATGKITDVEVKANTLEKDLSGLTQTVTDTKKVIENNKTSLESKNAELKANIDKVSSSLSSVSNTLDKNNKTLVSKTNTLEQTLSGLTQRVESNKAATDGKITSVENVTHELKTGLGGLTSKLDTLKSTTDGINKTLINQGSAINQLQDSIKLKVDNQTFTQSTSTINKNINNLNSDLVNKINSSLSTAKSYSDSKKQEAINSANSHADSKANESLNNAKAYTNAQVTTVNSNLSKATSEINILKNQISTKVGQSDIDRTVNNIQIGGRNLIPYSNDFTKWEKEQCISISKKDGFNIITRTAISSDSKGIYMDISVIGGQEYTLSFKTGFCNNNGFVGIGSLIPGHTPWNYYGNYKNLENNCKKSYTFKTDVEEKNVRVYFNVKSSEPIGTFIEIKDVKLELGNKATDWTPAPEDIDKEIVDNIKVVTDKINDVSTKLTQTKDSLQASVNSLDSTTQTITTNLTKTNNDLSNKINIAKNDAISSANSHADSVATTKANTAQSTAIAHADSKANDAKNQAINSANTYTNAQITTVNTRVSNAESNINILKNQISTKVSQSDIDRSINSIEFGGRNLILNSGYCKDLKYWGKNVGGGATSKDIFLDNGKDGEYHGPNLTNISFPSGWCILTNTSLKSKKFKFEVNEKYTIKGVIWTNNKGNVEFQIADDNSLNCVIDSIITINGWGYTPFNITFTPKIQGNENSIRFCINKEGQSIFIPYIKLVKGTINGDWTPAPEDIEQEIKDNITTVTTKISNVESNLIQKTDSITQRVNQVESTTNSLNGKITSNTNRISNAESKITPTAIINSVNNSIGSGGVIKGSSTILDKNKFTVMDTDNSKIEMQKGAITAYNNSGKKTYYLDDGEIGICAKDNSDPLGILTSVYKTSASNDTLGNNQSFTTPGGHGFKGVGLLAGDYAGYLTLGYDSVWGDDTKYLEFFRCHKAGWMHMGTNLNFSNEYSIRNIQEINRGNVADLYLNKIHIDQNCINTNTTDSKNLWLNYGLGYDCWKANATNDVSVRIGNGYNNGTHGNLVCQSLWVHGNKHRIVDCGDLGFIGMEAYETSTPYFGDIGNAKINEDGICYIIFDREFMEVCDTRTNYKVDISIVSEDLNSKVQVAKKFEDKVKIIGTPGTEFDYEIKAIQKGVDIKRFKRIDEERSDKTNYSINDNVKKLTSKYNNEINPDDGLMKDIELQRSFNLKRTINQLDKKTNKAMEMLNYTKGLKLNGKF